MKLYLDSSALVKLVRRENESEALRRLRRRHRTDERVTSELASVEVVRSVFGGGPLAVAHARRLLTRVHLVALDTDLLERVAMLAPGSPPRSLDAIHLATAQLLSADLRAVVIYDVRMTAATGVLGLPVVAPS